MRNFQVGKKRKVNRHNILATVLLSTTLSAHTALCGGSDKGVLFISVKDAVMHFRQDDQKQNLSFVCAGWKNPFTTELCF